MTTETWNPNLIERLKALWARGFTAGTIALQLNTSRDAVTSKARRLDLERRDDKAPMSAQEQMDRFADALSEGATIPEAGRRIGVRETRSREIYRKICDGLGPQAH